MNTITVTPGYAFMPHHQRIIDLFEVGLYKTVGEISDPYESPEGTGATYQVHGITYDGYLIQDHPRRNFLPWHRATPCAGHQLTLNFDRHA